MNKPLLTTGFLTKTYVLYSQVLLCILLSAMGLNAQTGCPGPTALQGVPTIACYGEIDTLRINPFNNANTYQLQVSPVVVGGVSITNLLPGNPAFVVDYGSVAGDYQLIFTIDDGTPCYDTFDIRVSNRFAPQVDCNDTIHLSLDESCNGYVYPSLVLEGIYDSADYVIVLKDINTNLPIPTSPYVNATHLGKYFIVEVIHVCSGNSCWGVMLVEDKKDPILECDTYIVACNAPYAPENVGFPLPTGAPNPVKTGTRKYRSTSVLVDNCGPTTLTYTDRISHADCPPPVPYIDTVFRDWVAMDSYGNDTYCTDTILIRVGDITAVTCPPNYDGFQEPALYCGDSFKKDSLGHPHPDHTGYPTFVSCRNLDFTYHDIRLNVCPGSYKILREWIVADWCTGTQYTCIQVIKVEDDRGPVFRCSDNITVSTLPNTCEGEAIIKLPLVFQECSAVTWEVKIKRGANPNTPPSAIDATTAGVTKFNNDSYKIVNIPVGLSWVLFIGSDGCGNTDTCATEVFVEEKTRPIAVCDLHTVVTLTDEGSAKVYAITFDDGSHDNCEMGSFKVRRMFPGNCPDPIVDDTLFRDYVEFCCNDIPANPVTVVLQVIDKAGNTNECMVLVTVQDKKPPVVTCLPDITVSCEFDRSNLSVFGSYRTVQADRKPINLYDPTDTSFNQPHLWGYDGLVIEDCHLITDSSVQYNINSCGIGTIERRFSFRDDFNPAVRCTQRIRVVDFTPFNGKLSITWPSNIEIDACHPNISADITGKPTWPNNVTCSNILATSDDQVFNIVENVCYKVLRTWTVVDWCIYNSQTGAGRWTYTQVIKIRNSQSPTFTSSCANRNFESTNSDCNGFATLIAEATDDCLPAQLVYSYQIDLGNNGSVDYSANGNNASGTYPVGTHKITWTVSDQCGNSSTCNYLFTILDRKLPTPVCQPGIITVIMPSNGQVTIWASDFDLGSRDNCTVSSRLRYAFSANPSNQSRTFTCAQIPNGVSQTFDIRVFVFDEAGNSDYCDTKITVQDGLGNACPDNLGNGTTGNLAGAIFNEANSKVESAMVTLSANMPNMPKYDLTKIDGHYAFVGLPLNENYTITAHKDDDPLNGVTTQDIVLIQRHILGLQSLNSPYKVIAADINNSQNITAKDVSDLRKLILGITNQFPDNKSWKFISAAQQFANVNNPWPYEEKSVIEKLASDKMDNNLIAIKMGDVSGNARTSNLQNVSQRNGAVTGLIMQDIEFTEQQMLKVAVRIDRDMQLSGMQFGLDYEPSALELQSVVSERVSLDESNYLVDPVAGKVKISFNQEVFASENDILMYLVFKSSRKGSLSKNLIMGSGFNAEVYNDAIDVSNLELRFDNGKSTSKGFYLYQNQPNPFNASTTIHFNIPNDGRVNLSIMDVNGKIIKKFENDFKAGLNSIEIQRDELIRSGLLYYQLEMGSYKAIRKMILIE